MKMKLTLLFAMMLTGSASMAQRTNYWVIESNKFDQGKTIVRIYDVANNLLYEETVPRDLNIHNRRDKKFLNRRLVDFNRADTTIAKNNKRQRRG